MSAAKKEKGPVTDAELRRRVRAKLAKMTKAQRIQSLVDAGILTKKTHRLTKVYREEPVLSYRSPLASAE